MKKITRQLPSTPASSDASASDHRTRVAAERKERTRLRLLQSALQVFNEKGTEQTVIDDVIAAAGVSRGTFYNHFRTLDELLLALATTMSDEVIEVLDPLVLQFDDPVMRFSVGTRLYMNTALRYPIWGRFITSVGTRIAVRGQLLERNLLRDVSLAVARGQLDVSDVLVARDIVLGSIVYGIETMLTEPTRARHSQDLVVTFLRGVGLQADEARTIAEMRLPPLGLLDGPIFSTLTPARSTRS